MSIFVFAAVFLAVFAIACVQCRRSLGTRMAWLWIGIMWGMVIGLLVVYAM